MKYYKKVKKIILGIVTFLVGLFGSQWSAFKEENQSLVKFNIPNQNQIFIKQSTQNGIVDRSNENENRTGKAGGAEIAKVVIYNTVSSVAAGIIITPNLENYPRITALSAENIWGIYVEESKIKT